MRWFRSSARRCGWLALGALAIQLGLSFGHVHAPPGSRPAAALTAAAAAVSTSPADTGDGGDTDYCAICAVVSLLSGVQIAVAPVLVLPIAPASAEITFEPTAAHVRPSRAAFHSRAPPLS